MPAGTPSRDDHDHQDRDDRDRLFRRRAGTSRSLHDRRLAGMSVP
ncbi:hypothetical protein ACFFSW_34800 [Saccharothrix longispora]